MTPREFEEPFVRFVDVDKTFDGQTLVIDDLNLDIRSREFLTLLGPSGSGKTTTLMMLAGFEVPTRGDIRLAGRSIRDLAPYKRDIGVVFQNYALFPHMTVGENVAFPLLARRVAKAERARRVSQVLDMVQLGGSRPDDPGSCPEVSSSGWPSRAPSSSIRSSSSWTSRSAPSTSSSASACRSRSSTSMSGSG